MSADSPIDIEYLARLARLDLSEEEKQTLAPQLEEIIAFVDQLQAVDVEGVEPTAHGNPRFNVWREDRATPPMDRDKLLQNAPAQREGQVVVPKVIEE